MSQNTGSDDSPDTITKCMEPLRSSAALSCREDNSLVTPEALEINVSVFHGLAVFSQ